MKLIKPKNKSKLILSTSDQYCIDLHKYMLENKKDTQQSGRRVKHGKAKNESDKFKAHESHGHTEPYLQPENKTQHHYHRG